MVCDAVGDDRPVGAGRVIALARARPCPRRNLPARPRRSSTRGWARGWWPGVEGSSPGSSDVPARTTADGATFVGARRAPSWVGHARLRDGTVERARRRVRRRERVRTVLPRAPRRRRRRRTVVGDARAPRASPSGPASEARPRGSISRTADASSSGVTPEEEEEDDDGIDARAPDDSRETSSPFVSTGRRFASEVAEEDAEDEPTPPTNASENAVSRFSSAAAAANENTSDVSATRVFPGPTSTVTRVTASPGAGLALVTARAYTNPEAEAIGRNRVTTSETRRWYSPPLWSRRPERRRRLPRRTAASVSRVVTRRLARARAPPVPSRALDGLRVGSTRDDGVRGDASHRGGGGGESIARRGECPASLATTSSGSPAAAATAGARMGAAGRPRAAARRHPFVLLAEKRVPRPSPPRVTSASPPSSPTTTSRVRNRSTTQNRAAASAKRRSGSPSSPAEFRARDANRRDEFRAEKRIGHRLRLGPRRALPRHAPTRRRGDDRGGGCGGRGRARRRRRRAGGQIHGRRERGGRAGGADDDASASSGGRRLKTVLDREVQIPIPVSILIVVVADANGAAAAAARLSLARSASVRNLRSRTASATPRMPSATHADAGANGCVRRSFRLSTRANRLAGASHACNSDVDGARTPNASGTGIEPTDAETDEDDGYPW